MKNLKFTSILLVLVLMFTLAACEQSNDNTGNDNANKDNLTETPIETADASNEKETIYPISITDSFDREVTIDSEPEKIISLSPAITEIVYALGQGDKLVGRTDYCDYPEEVVDIQSIGDLMDPNIEKIVELEPDIAIASAHFSEEVLKKLEESGVKVIILYGEESFDGTYEVIEKVGNTINANGKASDIVDNMKVTVADVVQKVQGLEKPSVYYVVSFGEYGDFTAGSDTFIGQLIEMAGAKNAADDVEGWSYSLEKLIEKNPDYLICSLVDKHKEQLKTANGYKDLDAVLNGKIYEIDKNKLERQGPRIVEGLKEIAQYIHPDAFE